MKICVAQTKPVKGNIQANIESHQKLISLALSLSADTIIFPELSLTGYEPTLAKELAVDEDNTMLDSFQDVSNNEQITIGVGVPVKSDAGILISMIVFQPQKPRLIYSKQHIHPDEEPYFVARQKCAGIIENTAL